MEEYIPTAKELRALTQGTPEWLVARRGKATASRCADIIAKTKAGKPTAARYNYLMELVAEHLTKRAIEHFVTPAMEWGIEQQPFAQAAYEIAKDCAVESVGLIVHPQVELFAASPDGLVGDDGLVEFKCPTDRVHIEYLREGVVPEDYIPQMNAQMACMPERQWVDFVSYNPHVPYGMQLFIRRHHRDQGRIEELETAVCEFLQELAGVVQSLTKAVPILPRTEVEEYSGTV